MREIQGNAKTVKELMKGAKYSIDYYQREYKWQKKQLDELIDDLSGKFLEAYDPAHERSKVKDYPHYFLGSIIISSKEDGNYIVDGQQRLTSLTLFFTYLRNRQKKFPEPDRVYVDDLIYSEKYGKKTFNLQIEDRNDCMKDLFNGIELDINGYGESAQTLVQRYSDIAECLTDDIDDNSLPYFIDWLLENVHFVEIKAHSDDDAYTIFETMNDRGLSLSPTEMLKGYLLANIDDNEMRTKANDLWRKRIHMLFEMGKDVESDFFKNWLRSQYSTKIRERKRGAKPEDWDRIGTEFHRWLRDSADSIGLRGSAGYCDFIMHNFDFYSRQYLRIIEASRKRVEGLEHILYNAELGFTLQNQLLLAPLTPDDGVETIDLKLRIVALYVDILLARRIWNSHRIAYSTMQYAMFVILRDIRGLAPDDLARKLHSELVGEFESFDSNDRLGLNQQNRSFLHRMLARITDFVETGSGLPPQYLNYIRLQGNARFEVEHIWANKPERHMHEFSHTGAFDEHRNRFGALLLLPKSFNSSYGALSYKEKLPHYLSQNLLARSLHPQCYVHNPGFTSFVSRTGLPFQPHPEFTAGDILNRHDLYREISKLIWDPDLILKEAGCEL